MKKKEFAFVLLIIIFAFFAVHWTIYSVNEDVKKSKFYGTDTYTRLVKVEQFHEDKDWYNHIIRDGNAPYGDEIHWTKPFDLLLYGGAIVLTPWLSFSEALSVVGVLISPFLGVLTLLALLWGLKKYMNEREIMIFCLLFFAQLIAQNAFLFGRPDHHSLLLLCFALFLGTAIKLISEKIRTKNIISVSVIGSLAIWISVESLVFTCLLIVVLALMWAVYGGDFANKLWKYSGAVGLFLSIFILIENGLGKFLVPVYDSMSVVHVFIFMLMSMMFILVDKLKMDKIKIRFFSCFIMLFIGIGAIYSVYPTFLKGPFAEVNPEIIPIWLSKVSEVQPVNSAESAIKYLSIMVVGMIYIAKEIVRNKGEIKRKEKLQDNLFTFIGIIVFIILTVYQIRWGGYGQLMSILPVTLLINELIIYFEKYKYRVLINIAIIWLFSFGVLTVSMLLPSDKPVQGIEPLVTFAEWMVESEIDNGNMLTFINYGPELMYRTNLKVVSAPYHRNDSGILFEHEVMSSTDMSYVHDKLESRNIKYILISSYKSETNAYIKRSDDILYNVLDHGTIPSYLNKISLPVELDDYKLFIFTENH